MSAYPDAPSPASKRHPGGITAVLHLAYLHADAWACSRTGRKSDVFSEYGGSFRRESPYSAVCDAAGWPLCSVAVRLLPGLFTDQYYSRLRRQKRLELLLGFLHERKHTHPSPLLLDRELIPVARI